MSDFDLTVNRVTEGNFTQSDATLTEFTASESTLELQTPTDELLYAPFDTDGDAIRSVGSGTAILTGSTISGGLNILSGTAMTQYPAASNLGGTTGCIRWKVRFGYSGTPANVQDLMAVSSTSAFNTIYVQQSGANILLQMRRNDNVLVVNANLGAYSPTISVWIEFEYNWDWTNNENRLFIGGTQQGSTNTVGTPNVRDGVGVDYLSFGAGSTGVNTANQLFDIDDVQSFSTVQHTANYTPVAIVPRYDKNIPTITNVTATSMDAWSAFSASVVDGATSSVEWCPIVDDVPYYHDGASWVIGNGTTQSNTVAEMNTNSSSLDISIGVDMKFREFHIATDGVTRSLVTSHTFTYDKFTSMVAQLICSLYGYVYDDKSAVVGAKITFKSRSSFFSNGNYTNIDAFAITNELGYFEIDLPETAGTSTKVDVVKTYTNKIGAPVSDPIVIIVPASTSSSLEAAIAP